MIRTAPIIDSRFRWQEDGWVPLIVAFVSSYSPKLFRVEGTIQLRPVQIYLRKREFPLAGNTMEYLELSAFQSRRIASGNYMLSILGASFFPIQTIGFVSSIEADKI